MIGGSFRDQSGKRQKTQLRLPSLCGMQQNVTATERAVQIAKAGEVGSLQELQRVLREEGLPLAILEGRSIRRQLDGLIKYRPRACSTEFYRSVGLRLSEFNRGASRRGAGRPPPNLSSRGRSGWTVRRMFRLFLPELAGRDISNPRVNEFFSGEAPGRIPTLIMRGQSRRDKALKRYGHHYYKSINFLVEIDLSHRG